MPMARKPVVCLPASGHPRPPSVAISVGTTPMIAIPVAAFMGSVAMIVGPVSRPRCNHFGHGRPMIAIPAADDCGSLHVTTALASWTGRSRRMESIGWSAPTRPRLALRSARTRCARPLPPMRSITRPTSPRCRSGLATPTSRRRGSMITAARGQKTARHSRSITKLRNVMSFMLHNPVEKKDAPFSTKCGKQATLR